MKIEECLIFSAGFGSRMGELGKILPKPAWPLFETTLLAAQVEFALELGCKRIFVNTHHLHDELKNSLPSQYNSCVTFVFEKEILGSGGGVHNLVEKKILKTDKLLTLNSDAFFFIPDLSQFEKIFDKLSGNRCLLMGATVSDQDLYKRMDVVRKCLVEIDDFPKKEEFVTYAGMGLINLEDFVPVAGKSNFFESVANFRNEPVRVVSMPEAEFWDFGTKKCYKENVYKLIDAIAGKKKTAFVNFLQERNMVDLKKIGEASYNAKIQGKVNFTSSQDCFEENGEENVIMIEAGENSRIYRI